MLFHLLNNIYNRIKVLSLIILLTFTASLLDFHASSHEDHDDHNCDICFITNNIVYNNDFDSSIKITINQSKIQTDYETPIFHTYLKINFARGPPISIFFTT